MHYISIITHHSLTLITSITLFINYIIIQIPFLIITLNELNSVNFTFPPISILFIIFNFIPQFLKFLIFSTIL